MSKKVVIFSCGGKMCNQLWLFANVYAYCLEKGYKCINYSFFESSTDFSDNYSKHFEVCIENNFFKVLFSKKMERISYRLFKKKYVLKYILHKIYIYILKIVKKKSIISAQVKEKKMILPPTNKSHGFLSTLERSRKNIYIEGWFFRNPAGLEKYHSEIVEYLKPKEYITEKINSQIRNIREKYDHVVGVHIRRGDFPQAYVSTERIVDILNEYLVMYKKKCEKTFFILCSDERIDMRKFEGFNIRQNSGNTVEDFFILSQTDLVLGSNSSFSLVASYYGNIPFIICTENIDWEYYLKKNKYFENKYSVCV